MSEDKKWYRVVDPISPLYGCDVRIDSCIDLRTGGAEAEVYGLVGAMRRLDIFVGDRPFQLIGPGDESLGLLIGMWQLADSQLQDETVELATDRPFGLCLSEAEVSRLDGHIMRIATYEKLSQIALENSDGELLVSTTCTQESADNWLIAFANGRDRDELVAAMRRN